MPDSHVPTTALAATPVLTAPLTVAEWQARAVAHLERAQQWTHPFRERRSRGEVHPVYDFLFQYYHYSGGRLEAWHPGPDESLEDSSAARERFTSPVYVAANGVIRRNASALALVERDTLHRVLQLLRATRDGTCQ